MRRARVEHPDLEINIISPALDWRESSNIKVPVDCHYQSTATSITGQGRAVPFATAIRDELPAVATRVRELCNICLQPGGHDVEKYALRVGNNLSVD